MASTSSSVTASPSTQGWTYDVFLSFRGPDVRKTFIDFLFESLERRGIHTFKDDDRLEKGDCISQSLPNAIRESKFFIAVFSKGYASSKWCLEELATVMECQEKLKEQIVVPIFYHVEPTDVRNQKGSYENSFKELHEKIGKDDEKVRRWKEALNKAGQLKGYHLKNDYNEYEATCAENVAADIHARLNHASLAFEENLVGLESRVNNIGNWLMLDSDDVRFIGICGMGGIGKTTIATAVFNRFSSQFEGACFLADVRQHNVIELQKTLLTKILKVKSGVKISNEVDGMAKIRTRLKEKKVLIVLDDVDDQLEQLERLAGGGHWFGRGSRVIITTRDARVLRSHVVDEKYIYEVETLGEDEAIQLFSLFAFKKEAAPDVKELSGLIVRYAMGLPLVLKVLGSYLCGLKAVYWKNILVKLKDSDSVHTPKDKILRVLMISFDGLDLENQNVFLHIACFLRNWREEVVKDVVDSDLLVLIEKSLISVKNGKIEMHDRIQEMGLHIASKENPRKMVWRLKDANDVFSGAMEHIEGIVLSDDQGPPEKNTFKITLSGMRNLKMLKVGGDIVFSIIDGYLPSSLRWLEIKSYASDSLPGSFKPSKLVGLTLEKSSLKNCRITQKLDKLTLLDLSYSKSLEETPDFDLMPNLMTLYLVGCENLKVVHSSIGKLRELVLLDLSRCNNLEELPSFNQVSCLKDLGLESCSKLKNFPEIEVTMPHLVELKLRKVGIIELPSSIQQLQGLTKLYLDDCEHLVCISNGFCELQNLKVLVINHCTNLKSLPKNLQDLTSLEFLNLNGSCFYSLPKSFNQLPYLQYLDIRNCVNLKKLPKLPKTTCQLYADSCFSYRRHIDELADFPKLQSVAFSFSYKVGRSVYDFADEMCIHFPSHRKTPFSVTYPIKDEDFDKVNVLRIFQYQCYKSNGIAIDLNPGWNCQSFVGFVICFLPKSNVWRLHSHSDIVDVEHCTIIVKLSCKDNTNEVHPTKCVIVKSSDGSESKGSLCFAYIPFSGLWPAKSNSVTPNDFSRFEVNFMGSEATSNGSFMESKAIAGWGFNLLYERSERPASWDDSCEGKEGEDEEMGESLDCDKDVGEYETKESNAGHSVEVAMSEHNDSGLNRTKLWKSTEIVDQVQCRIVSMPECFNTKVARLLYTNSGVGILALSSDGIQKLWKWPNNEQNPTGKATANSAPQHWKPNSGLLMINDVIGVNLEKVIPCIALSNDDSYIVSAAGGKISLFNIITFEVTETITLLSSAPTFLAFDHDDNNLIAIGTEKSSIHIYDRIEKESNELREHQKPITGLAFSTKLKLLVSSDADSQLCSWSTSLWKKKKSVRIQLPTGEVCSGVTHVMFHVDQLHLLVTHETQLAIYDASKMEHINQWIPHGSFSAPISSATYSCNCQLIYASFKDGNIGVFDAHRLRPRCCIAPSAYLSQAVLNRNEGVYAVVIVAHPQEPNQLAFGLTDGSIKVIEPLESGGEWGISRHSQDKIVAE
ncbi:PREDICTED: TMV resistance protein N-like isoform X2 [Ipomoea nil]|uniref:TMV resistance protein N-like isoform X2 n=1 Tax=Ipomoea nil TaxID=35883 RepID=UPI000901C14A|nr:PREDICTED: TMV resistance protein N-like isoform X2 [Ipomoea nil]